MGKGKVHMILGDGLGDRLIEIASEKLHYHGVKEMYEIFNTTMDGFLPEYVDMIMAGKKKLATNGNTLELVDGASDYLLDYEFMFSNFASTAKSLYDDIGRIRRFVDVEYFNLNKLTENDKYLKVVADVVFAAYLKGLNRDLEDDEMDAEDDLFTEYENHPVTYFARYILLMRRVCDLYLSYVPMYEYISKLKDIESTKNKEFEKALHWVLDELYYFNPTMVNLGNSQDYLIETYKFYRECLNKTEIGRMRCKNDILPVHIEYGYDAGWLAPDGTFYGLDGETRDLIHLRLAEKIAADRETEIGGSDYYLEKAGYVKIHNQEIYTIRNFTDKQVDEIIKYFEKVYPGSKICNPANKDKYYLSVSEFRAMDKIARRNTFKIWHSDEE